MENTDLKPPAPMAAQVLRLVGGILIVSFVLDILVLVLIAAQFGNPQWELNVVNQIVDRGVIPLIGFALLYAGVWIQNTAPTIGKPSKPVSPWQDTQFWTFILASLAGLLFLLAIPFNFSITGQLANAAIEQVNQQASQQESQITQEQNQLKNLVASGQAAQLLKNNQVTPQQRDLLTRAIKDPQVLDQQAKQLLDQIALKKTQAIAQANAESTQNRTRVSLRSLLMALGFTFIGWSGLRDSR